MFYTIYIVNTTQLLSSSTSKSCEFLKDLCKSMINANIRLNKFMNIEFRKFLEKYTHKDILRVNLL